MSDAKYISGPWTYEIADHGAYISDAEGVAVAFITMFPGEILSEDEVHMKAALISTTPDLLATLQELVATADNHDTAGHLSALEKAKGLILRATDAQYFADQEGEQ